jgi:hypothetical protein
MIFLKVEPYCQDCGEFEPSIIRNSTETYGHKVIRDTTIVCQNKAKCETMFSFIYQHSKNNTDTEDNK